MTGGYLAYVVATASITGTFHHEDVYWCMADIGGFRAHHKYIYRLYGPKALAAHRVLSRRRRPQFPRRRRPCRLAERLGVNIFPHFTPPSACLGAKPRRRARIYHN